MVRLVCFSRGCNQIDSGNSCPASSVPTDMMAESRSVSYPLEGKISSVAFSTRLPNSGLIKRANTLARPRLTTTSSFSSSKSSETSKSEPTVAVISPSSCKIIRVVSEMGRLSMVRSRSISARDTNTFSRSVEKRCAYQSNSSRVMGWRGSSSIWKIRNS